MIATYHVWINPLFVSDLLNHQTPALTNRTAVRRETSIPEPSASLLTEDAANGMQGALHSCIQDWLMNIDYAT